MATEAQKLAIAQIFVQEVHIAERQTAKVDSVELLAAAGDAYDWAAAAQQSYNTALPDPFKTVATTKQKAQLLGFAIKELVEAS